MWFWHYKLIPLGNDFQVFVIFDILFSKIIILFSHIYEHSDLLYTVLVSSTFLLLQFLEPPFIASISVLVWNWFKPAMVKPNPVWLQTMEYALHQAILLKQWFVIWLLVDCLSENPYPQETLK